MGFDKYDRALQRHTNDPTARFESQTIFVSTMLYAASKKMGLAGASGELMRQIQNLAEHGAQALTDYDDSTYRGMPAALTIARCAMLGEIQMHVNAGATVIGKGRSMAAHDFLAAERAAVWVSVDDDVIVSCDALAAMVQQCLREPCVVVAPCLQRDSNTVNIVNPSPVLVEPSTGCVLQKIEAGGFGCVAFSRSIIEQLYRFKGGVPWSDWTDEHGVTRRALFRDEIAGGKWYTEDLAFFRMPVTAYAVRRGTTTHGGQTLDLATLEAVRQTERSPLIV